MSKPMMLTIKYCGGWGYQGAAFILKDSIEKAIKNKL
jgi:hypothetical protein